MNGPLLLLIHLDDAKSSRSFDNLPSRQLDGASMARYRLKPVEVDAQPYSAGLEDEWAHAWRYGVLNGRYPTKQAADECPNRVQPGYCGVSVPVLITHTGRVELASGDWIITTSAGGRLVMKSEVFRAIYEPCEIGGEALVAA